MKSLTRRAAIGFGVLCGPALSASFARADDAEVFPADGRAVLFKIRDATIERADRDARTVAVVFGEGDRPLRMTNLPLAEGFKIRASYVLPGSVNNVPFDRDRDWYRMEGLVGKRVSMLLRAESGGLSVDSVAVA